MSFLFSAAHASYPATATFYEGYNSGSCGFGAISGPPVNGMIAAASEVLYKRGLTCGACYAVTCADTVCPTVVVRVTDVCPAQGNERWCGGSKAHLDLSKSAFVRLASVERGFLNVKYSPVCCPYDGTLRVRIDSINGFYVALSILGLPGTWGQAYNASLLSNGRAISLVPSWGAVIKADNVRLVGTYALRVANGQCTIATEPCIDTSVAAPSVVSCRVSA